MRNRSLIVLLAACLLGGCSTYDAVGIPANMVWEAIFDLEKDRSSEQMLPEKEPGPFWNPETSHCIRQEKNDRSLEGSLDRLFADVEAGQEYVELPTGERYPVNSVVPRFPYADTPTRLCMAQEDD